MESIVCAARNNILKMQLQDESSSAETSGSDDGSSEDEGEAVAEGLASSALIKTDLFVTGQSKTTA